MVMLINLLWAVVPAFGVYKLLERELERRRSLTNDDWVVGAPSPSSAAAVTFFFALAAPFFLGKHRGMRGVLEGFGLLGVVVVGSFATQIGLALLSSHR